MGSTRGIFLTLGGVLKGVLKRHPENLRLPFKRTKKTRGYRLGGVSQKDISEEVKIRHGVKEKNGENFLSGTKGDFKPFKGGGISK